MEVKQTARQLFLYLIVGGLATIVEWAAFYVLNVLIGVHYLTSTALAFILSTLANWLFGRLILFKENRPKSLTKELIKIYATSIIGLLLNMLIMYLAVEKFGIYEMFSKIIASGLVFFWNFFIRKLLIYKI